MRSIIITTLIGLMALIAWRHLIGHGALFYQGILFGVCAAIGQGLWSAKRRAAGQAVDVAKDMLLVFLLIYAFVFTIPTTVDRSYSVRMLQRLADAPDGLMREDLVQFFAEQFVAEGGVDRRLREQRQTGAIVETAPERWQLTTVGHGLTAAFTFTARLFACQHP